MNQNLTELIVGAFVVVGMIALGYLTIHLGKVELFGSTGYILYADFTSVAGLKLGDPVEIAGVKVGKIESIALAENEGVLDDQGRLGLRIDPEIKLEEDAIASVRARGLIGDKFVSISFGGSEKLLGPGDKIRETESPPSITDVIGKYISGDMTSKEK